MSEVQLKRSLEYLVSMASRAPSPHNTQPWRFRQRGGAIELLADRARTLPVTDPDGRELTIACGAALLNLRLAVGHLGRDPVVDLLPDSDDPDLMARVSLGAARPPDAEDELLLAAVTRRYTHRGPFDRRPLDRSFLVELQLAAEAEGARLAFVEGPGTRRTLAGLVATAESTLRGDPRFRDELAHWTPDPDEHRRDGVPVSAYPPTTEGAAFAMRDFALGLDRGRLEEPGDEAEPAVVVLLTENDRPVDRLRAGMALERVLLLAARHWAFAAFLSAPTELTYLREALRTSLGLEGFPQEVLRLGHVRRAAATPRLPVQRVLMA